VKRYLVRISADFIRLFKDLGVAPYAVVEAESEEEAIARFRESIPIVAEELILDEPEPPTPKREVSSSEG